MFGELEDSAIYENSQDFDILGMPGRDDEQGGFANSYDSQGSFLQDDEAEILSSNETVQQQFVEEPVPPVVQTEERVYQQNDGKVEEDAFSDPERVKNMKPKSSSGSLFFVVLLIVVALAAVGMFAYKKYVATDASSQSQSMGDMFYDQATNGQGENTEPALVENTATVDVDLNNEATPAPAVVQQPVQAPVQVQAPETPAAKADNKKAQAAEPQKERFVNVTVTNGGRLDPFLPYGAVTVTTQSKYDLIAPPLDIPEADPVIDEVMQAKISGIMYDNTRPSAIVNFGDADQLVHKGDVVNGMKVIDITKNTVVIKYKTNIYRVSVGQSIDSGVNLNPVSNLSNQFGGAYSKKTDKVLQFN